MATTQTTTSRADGAIGSASAGGNGPGLGQRLYQWADERLGLGEIQAFAAKKVVPEHRYSFWYYWGGISLFLFLIQAFTGTLLLIYFRPGPEAYESVRQITYEIHFGWLIRSAHSWSANLMVLSVMVHMFSVALMKAYRRPREITWWSGLVLLLVTMTFGFSGYLLPWDELSFFATKVGLDVPQNTMPVLGPFVATLLRGGPEVSPITLQRFFALHVVVLPAAFLGLLGLHLWLVQKHGNAAPPSEEAKPADQRRSVPFFPNFLMKDLAMWLITLNVIAIFASFFPWQLGSAADPLKSAPPGIHPEWYFMSAFQVLKLCGNIRGAAGEYLGVGIFNVGLALWALLPLYDTSTKFGQRARFGTYFVLLALAFLVVTTIWAYAAL